MPDRPDRPDRPDGADRDDRPDLGRDDLDLGMSAYLQARTQAEETVVRAAFDDLRARVRAEVKAPPPRVLEIRARRRQVRAARRRVGLAAAAAAVLVGGAVLVVQDRPGGDGPAVVASRPAPERTNPSAPGTSTAPATPTPDAVTTSSVPAATRTVVVTATQPSRTRTRQPSATATRTTPASAPTTSAGPRTEVTVYLWQGSLYPTCLSQYAVKRTVDGTGGWTAAVSAALAGATASEKAAGYVSPFGPGVQATVDEAAHTVDFGSTSAFDRVPPLCRASLESLVTRTAIDAGHPTDMKLRGSSLLWTNWRIGLL